MVKDRRSAGAIREEPVSKAQAPWFRSVWAPPRTPPKEHIPLESPFRQAELGENAFHGSVDNSTVVHFSKLVVESRRLYTAGIVKGWKPLAGGLEAKPPTFGKVIDYLISRSILRHRRPLLHHLRRRHHHHPSRHRLLSNRRRRLYRHHRQLHPKS